MIVVDSSAVVDALTMVEGSEAVRDIIRGEALHAPSLLDFEVVSAVRGLTHGGAMSPTRAVDALDDFALLPIRRWDSSAPLRRRSFALRDNVSAYDAAYVSLAEALECPLLTRDARLARAAQHLVDIRLH